jgi:hypothetical protein
MLQEPVADSWSVPSAGDAWPRLLRLILDGFERRGGDFDAGRHLERRLRQAGLRQVRTRRVVHTLPSSHPYARLPLSFCASLSALWQSAGMAGADQVQALRCAVEAALEEEDAAPVTTFTLVQAWGQRPG